jgi:Spy/CpxP family protein refolding chaperone
MKRILLTAALAAGSILAAGLPAAAQTATDSQTTPSTPQQTKRGHWHHRHHNRAAYMAKKLNLTQDQQTQLKPIFEKQHEQAKAIKNDSSLTADQKKEKFQSLRQGTMAQVNNILTPEQQQQWQQMKAKHQHGSNGETQPPAAAPQG